VVADFDEFQGGVGGKGYSGGGAYDDYGGDGDGQYDQEEQLRGYAM
jgi:hypothetical protein